MNSAFMQEAIMLARKGMQNNNGGPFGAVIVRNNEIIGRGFNKVTTNCDPTAHAEVVAIREACSTIGNFSLAGCEIYSNCEPCPMCLAAIYWARIEKIYYANTQQDAQAIGFDDAFFYAELNKSPENRLVSAQQLLRDEALAVFSEWERKVDKIPY